MSKQKQYVEYLRQYYRSSKNNVLMGSAKFGGQILADVPINIPIKNLNRHGLVAGATGTGKTKTLQLLAEALSTQGVNVLLMDVKGDLSGLAAAGETNDTISERMQLLNLKYHPKAYPVELLSISDELGVRLRGTISEFGPILFARMLGLNETQTGIIAVIFKYCGDKNLSLLDLKDLKSVVQYLTTNGRNELTGKYGNFSISSLGTILRKIIELEQQNTEIFFGEPSFEVTDLLKKDKNGLAAISILRLIDIQNKPKLFSTFMLSLLNEIYFSFPEIGDIEKPKLVIVIDEAHLLFSRAPKALLDKIEFIVRLIRSKGVGVIFCTQSPKDIPDNILSQLGLKIQHAMRAFTAKDRKAIKLVAENYPLNPHLKIDELLTTLGIGEALISVLDAKGRPTPTVHTYLTAPSSRMGPLTETEIDTLIESSALVHKYKETLDRESAYEILKKRMEKPVTKSQEKTQTKKESRDQVNKKESNQVLESLSKNTMVRQMGRTFLREIIRGIFAIFGMKKPR